MRIYTNRIERSSKTEGGNKKETIFFEVNIDERQLNKLARVAANSKYGIAMRGPFAVNIVGTVESVS